VLGFSDSVPDYLDYFLVGGESGVNFNNPTVPEVYVDSFLIPDESGGFTTEAFVSVAPVPVPAAMWLFGSGLLGLVGIARRKKAA